MAVSPELLQKVRNYLDITWVDPAGDEKLKGIIARGIVYINRIAGVEQDYEAEGAAQGLLFNYCLYERSDKLDEFQQNYLHELLGLQLDERVKAVEQDA